MADGVENTNGARDRREQIEFGVEGTYERVVGERYYERLIGPNQWPTSDGGRLRTEVERFQRDMDDVCRRLTRFLAMGLGCDDAFDDAFARPNVQMKLCRYPPTDDSEFGVGEHSDSGFLTLLVQDDVGGLQVKNPDTGEWIDAPPIPGTVVVNLGEMIQLVTGGYLIATPHRVRNSSTQSRFSVPWFWNPCLDYRVVPIELPEDLPWCRPKPAEGSFRATASHGGDNVVHDCYGANAFKSLARSHPAVTAIHHSDLEILSSGAVVHRDPSTR
ncbi:hypothetical protein BE221DRAFT_187613 [Ostreococcus tauri]|uniref:Fe2OG dioxygenase domain-containing protein n=1 Tax=Ostreococcus tauri TaxID=70448 RepID=A0A1Y5I000_OSTTA|nr:hypothetical protein BE221DRAFT_187613 [Ostreococcus tauri]